MQGHATRLIDSFLAIDELSYTISNALIALPREYGAFTFGLNDQAWRASVEQSAPPALSAPWHRFWASETFNCLDHRHDGDGRDTWQMAGILVVPQAIIEMAQQLNQHKDIFARHLQHYRGQTASKPPVAKLFQEKYLDEHYVDNQASRKILTRLGRSRIHLRHVTRHIVCLKEYPKFISLSWVRQRRSIQKISVTQAVQKLEKLNRDSDSSHIQMQIEKLRRLPVQQQHLLRQVQTVAYPSLKTKVYWNDGSDSHLGYLSVPALVPEGSVKQLPPMTDVSPTPPAARAKRRSDNRLPEEAFCPSIRVFLAMEEESVI